MCRRWREEKEMMKTNRRVIFGEGGSWVIFEKRKFVVAMWVMVQGKEKEENGLVWIVVLLLWGSKGGIRWVHLIQGPSLTSQLPRSVITARSRDPNRSYFGVLEKQQRWGKGWQHRLCGAGREVGQGLVGLFGGFWRSSNGVELVWRVLEKQQYQRRFSFLFFKKSYM